MAQKASKKKAAKKGESGKVKSLGIGQSSEALRRASTWLRGGLLSNDPDIVAQTQTVISNYLDIFPTINSLNRWKTAIEPWVHNKQGFKTRRHIKQTRADAQFDALAYPDDFTTQWVLALAHKYCRNFQACLDTFEAANKLYATAKDKRDLHADWAEFYVYIGETETALAKLEESVPTEDWHPWVHAFALHQHAFTKSPDNPDKEFYEASNAVLHAWDPSGAMVDAKLIEAANYAGLNDSANAQAALEAFLTANPKWSIAKEKRGPFIKRLPLDDDPDPSTTAGKDKKKFRRRYAKHFFDNLRAARPDPNHLKESEGNDDGEWIEDSDAEADD